MHSRFFGLALLAALLAVPVFLVSPAFADTLSPVRNGAELLFFPWQRSAELVRELGGKPEQPLPAGVDLQALRRAAKQGDATARHRLGELYRDGAGLVRNERKAVDWFRQAAEQGYAPAQTSLGWMYMYGRGVAQDDKEAMKWFRLAAAQGYVQADKGRY